MKLLILASVTLAWSIARCANVTDQQIKTKRGLNDEIIYGITIGQKVLPPPGFLDQMATATSPTLSVYQSRAYLVANPGVPTSQNDAIKPSNNNPTFYEQPQANIDQNGYVQPHYTSIHLNENKPLNFEDVTRYSTQENLQYHGLNNYQNYHPIQTTQSPNNAFVIHNIKSAESVAIPVQHKTFINHGIPSQNQQYQSQNFVPQNQNLQNQNHATSNVNKNNNFQLHLNNANNGNLQPNTYLPIHNPQNTHLHQVIHGNTQQNPHLLYNGNLQNQNLQQQNQHLHYHHPQQGIQGHLHATPNANNNYNYNTQQSFNNGQLHSNYHNNNNQKVLPNNKPYNHQPQVVYYPIKTPSSMWYQPHNAKNTKIAPFSYKIHNYHGKQPNKMSEMAKPVEESQEKEEAVEKEEQNRQNDENESIEDDGNENYERDNEEEEEEGPYNDEESEESSEDSGYKVEEDDSEDNAERGSSKISKKSKKPRKNNSYVYKNKSPYKNKDDYYRKPVNNESKKGKMQYKSYKYSKKGAKRPKFEYIEGKYSQNVPVVHNQKFFKEKWFISNSHEELQ